MAPPRKFTPHEICSVLAIEGPLFHEELASVLGQNSDYVRMLVRSSAKTPWGQQIDSFVYSGRRGAFTVYWFRGDSDEIDRTPQNGSSCGREDG